MKLVPGVATGASVDAYDAEHEEGRHRGPMKAGSTVIGPAELATLCRLVNGGVSVTQAARTLKVVRGDLQTSAPDTSPSSSEADSGVSR